MAVEEETPVSHGFARSSPLPLGLLCMGLALTSIGILKSCIGISELHCSLDDLKLFEFCPKWQTNKQIDVIKEWVRSSDMLHELCRVKVDK